MANAQHTPGLWIVGHSFTTAPAGVTKELTSIYANNGNRRISDVIAFRGDLDEAEANARLIAASPALLAYAECEEAKHVSLLPTNTGGTGNSQSYMEVFNKHGWDGRDVYGFLDKLRRTAIAQANGNAHAKAA